MGGGGRCLLTVAASRGTRDKTLAGAGIQEIILKAAQKMFVLFCDLRHIINSNYSNRQQSNDEMTKLTFSTGGTHWSFLTICMNSKLTIKILYAKHPFKVWILFIHYWPLIFHHLSIMKAHGSRELKCKITIKKQENMSSEDQTVLNRRNKSSNHLFAGFCRPWTQQCLESG